VLYVVTVPAEHLQVSRRVILARVTPLLMMDSQVVRGPAPLAPMTSSRKSLLPLAH
jgi:hypothetical protein